MKKSSIFVVLIVAFLGIIFFIRPKSQTSSFATKTFHLTIAHNKVLSGPSVLQVNENDTVVIVIKADVSGKFQLHGYNNVWHFTKDKPTTIRFTANIAGRFPYELEDTDAQIGALEVYPK